MPNPLNQVIPILNLLGKEIRILPAIGGAVEDLQHPDQDEIDDKIINKDSDLVNSFAEIPTPNPQNMYRATPPSPGPQKYLFRYFIDGSIYTYFLGTGIEGERSFPIELAQVGGAVIAREDDGSLKVFQHNQKILLLLPKQNQGISDTLWNQIEKMPKPDFLDVVDFTLPDLLSDSKKDPRDKAAGKAKSIMHKLEIELIKSTDKYRNENNWLILDGAVKFIEEDIWNSWKLTPYIIGVAKNFRKDPIFQLGAKSTKRKDLTGILAGLQHGYRTVAFSSNNGEVAFFYVRLREQKELDYPLMGVIKVEVPLPNKTPISSELADLIASSLVAERNVTPYGLDRRWHCTLYPIHIAEQVIKNRFYSKEVLMGCFKWPKLNKEE